ncbi:hypothetical protein N431DRAFT_428923 [Stipitochalara longipes BDJ]|nr:hypothetical protein N431DRAFT_428923 [Stipitochalara longipes BDJ]
MLSISDSLALSFGIVSSALGIIAVVVTRRSHNARSTIQLAQHNNSAYAQYPRDVILEEIHLRRWRAVSDIRWENGHAQPA